MNNAYECKETFSREGKCLKRERTVGAIVPWSLVTLAGLVMGHFIQLPGSFWQFFKP
jgi:hypothetical protein